MDIGDALRARVTDRVNEALARYFDGKATGHVTVTRDGSGYATECVLHLSSGMTLQAIGAAMEAYQSADAAAQHLEKRLRRYKQRLKDHHAGRHAERSDLATSYIIAAPTDVDEESASSEYHPVIIAEATTDLRRLSVGEAVIELDLSGVQVLVFRHAGHGRVNVVYRRPDGNIGWVDPPSGMNS